MRPVVSVLVVTAALATVVAGCGGGASAEEKWADSVCTDVTTWKGEVKQATDDITAKLQSPQAGTLAAIDADVRKAIDATGQLSQNLKALGAPNTDSGAQAKQRLDALASQLEATVNKAQQTLATVPKGAGVTEVAKELAPLAPALQSLADNTSSTLQAIQASADDLKKGFEDADSCEDFR